MATKRTYSAKINVCIYDRDSSVPSLASLVLGLENFARWDKDSFRERALFASTGIKTMIEYKSALSPFNLDRDSKNGAQLSSNEELIHLRGGDLLLGHQVVLSSNGFVREDIQSPALSSYDGVANSRVKLSNGVSGDGLLVTRKRRLNNLGEQVVETFQQVGEFTVFPDKSLEKSPGLSLSLKNVVSDRGEFFLDKEDDGGYLIFNQDILLFYSSVPSFQYQSNQERILSLDPPVVVDAHVLYTEFFPLLSSTFALLSKDSANVVSEWTKVSSLSSSASGAKEYVLDPLQGKIFLNESVNLDGLSFFVEYISLPCIEYLIANKSSTSYVREKLTSDRVVTNTDGGSFFLAFGSKKKEAVNISVEIPSLSKASSLTYEGSLYGDAGHSMLVRVQSQSTGKPVSDVQVKASLEGIGGLSRAISRTSSNGTTRMVYAPPGLYEPGSFVYMSRDATGTGLEVQGKHYLHSELSRIYAYGIYKDDPLVGRVFTGGEPRGTIRWDPNVKNGSWRVQYIYDASAINPTNGLNGAFVPLLPQSLTDSKLVYGQTLSQDNAFDDTNNLGGYVVRGPRFCLIKFEAYDVYGQLVGETTVKIVTRFGQEADGILNVNSSVYPFGFRLPGSIDPSSQLGGNLFLTINEAAGNYSVLFEPNITASRFTTELPIKVEVSVA